MRAIVVALAILLPPSALADGSSVVIAVGYSPNVPSVRMQVRAEYVAVPVSVQSDAREAPRRIDQIESALRAVSDRVKPHADLAVRFGVVSLSPRDQSKSIGSYESYSASAQLYVLGLLKADTTVFAVTKRIHQVMTGMPVPDGTKVVLGNATLAMSDPERFRPQLLGLISKSAAETRKSLGASGPVEIEGLESPVTVMQANESDVVLFIGYRAKIQMRAT